MNERIQELAEQAGLKVNPDGEIGPAFFGSVDAGYRKFAELIVRECANAIINDNRLNDVRSASRGCVRTINEHFGVEE